MSKTPWYGWLPDRPDQRDLYYTPFRLQAAVPLELPVSVDLRSYCSNVENQGALGSCTAQAIVGNLEFLQRRKNIREATLNLSRLFVYYNERALEGTIEYDSGAYIRDGIKVVSRLGAPRESLWPYKISKFKEKPTNAAYADGKLRSITLYQRLRNLNDIRQCLSEGYPVVFGFTVYESFESKKVATTGIMPMPLYSESILGGHAVLAVGYNDETRYLTVRNSWGSSWGDRGYFYMPYDYINQGNLAADFWTIRG